MSLPLLTPNTIIVGKWNKNSYKIVKKLGEGGVGAVYQITNMADNKRYALKLSEDNISINREYGLLQELDGIHIIVNCYEIDDLEMNSKIYHFIVIEYIHGTTLNKYRKNKKITTVEALGIAIILLKFMGELHEKGYILGDAKLDNIMVNNEGKIIRFIDLGGVVRIGATIKEFTPAYDRASWQCGDRISEVSYDLFSATMILIQLLLEIDLHPKKQSAFKIKERLNCMNSNMELKKNIIDVMDGKKKNAKDFANTILNLYNKERELERTRKIKSTDNKINLYFFGSLTLLISTIWIILFK